MRCNFLADSDKPPCKPEHMLAAGLTVDMTAVNYLVQSGDVMAGEMYLPEGACIYECEELKVHSEVTRGPFDETALNIALQKTTLRNTTNFGYDIV